MSSLDEYSTNRAALIAEDRALRVDHARAATHTTAELQADAIVRRIRKEEEEAIWAKEHDDVPHPFPGMEFLTGKHIILKTKLFKLLSKMPKGALLHAHLDITVNSKSLLELALQYPTIHICAPTSINAATISSVSPEFKPHPPGLSSSSGALSLSVTDYIPNTWIPLQTARENFAPSLGGKDGFDTWILGKMSITPSEAYITHNNNIRIWDKFREAINFARPLVYYFPLFEKYVKTFLLETVADGVSYIEARINFSPKYMVGEDGQENVPHREWLITINKVAQDLKQSLKERGCEDDLIGIRIIYTIIRDCSLSEMEWYLEDCLALKKEFPHLIAGKCTVVESTTPFLTSLDAGFDLVGDENILKPLIDYIEPLLGFQKRQKELGLDVPFIFHGGETCGDGTKADVNLYDAILLGTKRIGHGFSLVKHPKLMQICREKGIAIEVCPISNEILRLTASMTMHPLPILLNNGVPVALSSDDPTVFQNMGLSFDFFQVLAASEVTSLLTLGHLARDSITYSTLEDIQKAYALAAWEKRWTTYVQAIVALDGAF
ncbi:Metallo-dependent hydrolase [Hygrophoropsis aurantiaca]|uniref:Metallo-dependent hydrolase n=1 Tax=Hygrophoropsis aurantiaca TaxID=72124 RepID=A0ACB8A746_9AGAM|nr:Metallo-dependent hydrolase [Hygrophoropsis aurantiaca]